MRGLRMLALIAVTIGVVAVGANALIDRTAQSTDTPTGESPSSEPSPTVVPSPTPELEGGWKHYVSEKGRFSIVAPGRVAEDRLAVKLWWGRTVFHEIAFLPDISKDTYRVYYVDLPSEVIARHPADVLLSAFQRGAVSGYEGRKVKEHPITIEGYPCRDVSMELGDFEIVRLRMCLVEKRFYEVEVVSVRSHLHPDRQRALRFLRSFRVISPIQIL